MLQKKKYSYQELLNKMMRYCAMEEKSVFDLKIKLYNLNASKEEIEKIIDQLIDDNFLNEERYVRVFIKGKLNSRKWGRIKIENALRQKNVSSKLIEMLMEETINPENYQSMIQSVLEKKMIELETKELETQKMKEKLFFYAASKGYEKDLIFSFMNQYFKV